MEYISAIAITIKFSTKYYHTVLAKMFFFSFSFFLHHTGLFSPTYNKLFFFT